MRRNLLGYYLSTIVVFFGLGCKDSTTDHQGQEPTVETPTISLPPGTYFTSQYTVIQCATPGAIIRYTVDGTDPTATNGKVITHGDSVLIAETTTLKAVANVAGWHSSGVAGASYTIIKTVASPIFTPGEGVFTSPPTIVISCSTAGATIRYTTDGSDPSETNGTIIVSGNSVLVSDKTTLKAIAYRTDSLTSQITSAAYFTLNWESLPGPVNAAIEGLAFFPNRTIIALANNVVYLSIDDAASWQPLSTTPTGYRLKGVGADQNGNVFVGTEKDTSWGGLTQTYVGVLKSSDGGNSWQNVFQQGPGPHRYASIGVNETGDVMVGMGGPGFGYSTDQGNTWATYGPFWTIGVAVTDSRGMLASSAFQGIVRSTDLGATWFSCSCGGPIYRDMICLSNDTVFVGGTGGDGGEGIYRSTDGGITFELVLFGYHPTVFGKDPSGAVYFGTTGNLYCSIDGGVTWHAQALTGLSIKSFAFRADGLCLVGSATGRIYRTY